MNNKRKHKSGSTKRNEKKRELLAKCANDKNQMRLHFSQLNEGK